LILLVSKNYIWKRFLIDFSESGNETTISELLGPENVNALDMQKAG
jgi:hypothetical protein